MNQKDNQFSVRMTEEEAQTIHSFAEKLDLPYAQMIRFALKKYVMETKTKLTKGMVTIINEEKSKERLTKAMVVRVSERDLEALMAVAEGLGVKRSLLVRYAMRAYFDEV